MYPTRRSSNAGAGGVIPPVVQSIIYSLVFATLLVNVGCMADI